MVVAEEESEARRREVIRQQQSLGHCRKPHRLGRARKREGLGVWMGRDGGERMDGAERGLCTAPVMWLSPAPGRLGGCEGA